MQVIDDSNKEVLYTLRINRQGVRLPVFKEGLYTLRIGELGGDRERELHAVRASTGALDDLVVDLR